jgi:hypothetical protein
VSLFSFIQVGELKNRSDVDFDIFLCFTSATWTKSERCSTFSQILDRARFILQKYTKENQCSSLCHISSNGNLTFYNINMWCHFSVSFKLEILKMEAMINLIFLFFTFFNLNKSVRCSTQVASYLTKILDNSKKNTQE